MSADGSVLALSGGVGGAKLALGLYRVLLPDTVTVVANTGDDFEHLGLSISPDLDTLLYTLSGQDNPELGWGRAGETWTFMAALEALGGEIWFRLGDCDLATHVERSRRRAARRPCARRGGAADHGGKGVQGPDRQDDRRAGPADRCRDRRAALPRLPRPLHRRRGGCRRRCRSRCTGGPYPNLDAEPRRPRGLGPHRSRRRRPHPQMSAAGEICAVVPVKETAIAKQRLASALPPELRQALALAMLEDVLAA